MHHVLAWVRVRANGTCAVGYGVPGVDVGRSQKSPFLNNHKWESFMNGTKKCAGCFRFYSYPTCPLAASSTGLSIKLIVPIILKHLATLMVEIAALFVYPLLG